MVECIHLFSYNPGNPLTGNTPRDCIIGSTFCEKYRIDFSLEQWMDIIPKIKEQYENIYIQQPFYLINEQYDDFIACTEMLSCRNLINGVIVNSYGMVIQLNKRLDLKLVVGRYAIGKRNKVNRNFIELLLAQDVTAWEVFPYSHDIIRELLPFKNSIEIWVRDTDYRINGFSRNCFIKAMDTMHECTGSACTDNDYFFKEKSNNFHLKLSGHILYEDYACNLTEELNDYVLIRNDHGVEI